MVPCVLLSAASRNPPISKILTNMAVETGSPIAGDQSYSVSSFPASTPDVTIDERRSGKFVSVSLVQKLASGSYKIKVVDNTASTLAEVTIDTNSSQKVVIPFGIPSAATTVKLELEDVSSATTVIIDDIEFSDDAYNSIKNSEYLAVVCLDLY